MPAMPTHVLAAARRPRGGLLVLAALTAGCAVGAPAAGPRALALRPAGAPAAARPGITTAPWTAAPRAAAVTTHRVRMVGDEKGYRFVPARLTIDAGDRVTFVLGSGAPHNVQFDAASVPEAGRARLAANMRDAIGELTGPMLMDAGQTYTISFAGVPAGTYAYVCTPHQAMNMKGTIVVRAAGRAAATSARRKGD